MASKFAVVREQQHKQFTKWHDDFESAKAEAERLCGESGAAFVIVKTIGVVRPERPPIVFVPDKE